MKTPLRSLGWRDPSDGTAGPVQSGVRARVLPIDEETLEALNDGTVLSTPSLSSDQRITAPPPPLDYEDELSAQTVMRALPAELLAKLKRNAEELVEPPDEPDAFDDEATRVGPIPMLAEMIARETSADPERFVGPAPVVARPADVVSTSRSAELADPAKLSQLVRPPDVALLLPDVRPRRDGLPYILLGLGLGLAILLAVCYGR